MWAIHGRCCADREGSITVCWSLATASPSTPNSTRLCRTGSSRTVGELRGENRATTVSSVVTERAAWIRWPLQPSSNDWLVLLHLIDGIRVSIFLPLRAGRFVDPLPPPYSMRLSLRSFYIYLKTLLLTSYEKLVSLRDFHAGLEMMKRARKFLGLLIVLFHMLMVFYVLCTITGIICITRHVH